MLCTKVMKSDSEKTLGDIFYTSFDPIFLMIEDGYAMSEWILDSRERRCMLLHTENGSLVMS